MTTPPDFSQSSTPFSLLVPRHPPHALTSLAALFHSLALVLPLRQRSRTLLPARLFHSPVWDRRVRRCCLSLLRLVSCVADRSSAPASADRTRVPSDRGQAASNQDATTCLPKLSKIGRNRSGRFRPFRRAPTRDRSRTPHRYLCRITPQVLLGTRVASPSEENVSGVACPCQPVPRFFFSSRFRRVFQRFETSRNFGTLTSLPRDPRSNSPPHGRFSVSW